MNPVPGRSVLRDRPAPSSILKKETGEVMNNTTRSPIESIRVPAPVKLSLLWASLMSLYIYNDYIVLFVPGVIEEMAAGSLGPLGEATAFKLVVVALVMAIPASMVFLSSMLPSSVARWLNMIIGPIYTVLAVLTLFGSPPFYKFIVSIQIVATLLIFWTAWRWPKQDQHLATAGSGHLQ